MTSSNVAEWPECTKEGIRIRRSCAASHAEVDRALSVILTMRVLVSNYKHLVNEFVVQTWPSSLSYAKTIEIVAAIERR